VIGFVYSGIEGQILGHRQRIKDDLQAKADAIAAQEAAEQ